MAIFVTPIRITLRAAREAAGLTQEQLAERAGVRRATISDLESGDREGGRRHTATKRLVDLDVIEKLCRVLGVAPGDLLVLDPKFSRKRK